MPNFIMILQYEKFNNDRIRFDFEATPNILKPIFIYLYLICSLKARRAGQWQFQLRKIFLCVTFT